MWRVNITCSEAAWKINATAFKTLAAKYDCISSQKMPDGTRIMAYKIDDVNDAEDFQQECANLPGFTSDFESL
ncbi:hypothetical protein [Fortiea contorta]|uniref:hypothetical protein n=1 Tax=Fortiea contorta TaxID=1892405 RepID=UPI00035DDF9A|nr:hypothetical protein [Fortiea contorta]